MQIESRTCQACLGNYAEMQLCFCKANANREQNLPSLLEQLCRDAALLLQSYINYSIFPKKSFIIIDSLIIINIKDESGTTRNA